MRVALVKKRRRVVMERLLSVAFRSCCYRIIMGWASGGAPSMTSRRNFLRASAAGGLLTGAVGHAAKTDVRYPEVEARIARHDFRGLTKEDLGTPCLILDQAIFEQN